MSLPRRLVELSEAISSTELEQAIARGVIPDDNLDPTEFLILSDLCEENGFIHLARFYRELSPVLTETLSPQEVER